MRNFEYGGILKFSLGILLLSVFSLQSVYGQKYKFRSYTIEDNLCHPFVYTIIQDQNGFLWASTGEGLCRFDGMQFMHPEAMDSLTGAFAGSSFKDSKNRIWFGHNDGILTLYENFNFTAFQNEDITQSSINGIAENPADNAIYIATQNDGIAKISGNSELISVPGIEENTLIYTLTFVAANELLIGSNSGLMHATIENNAVVVNTLIETVPETKIQVVQKNKVSETYFVGTQDEGLFEIHGTEGNFALANQHFDSLAYMDVQTVSQDENGNLWVGTFGEGLFRYTPNSEGTGYEEFLQFSEENGINGKFIKSLYTDYDGNTWIGTYGNGLAALIDDAFTFYALTENKFGENALALEAQNGNYYLGTAEGITIISSTGQDAPEYIGMDKGLPNDAVSALHLNKEWLWIGTATSGLYRMNLATKKVEKYFVAENSLSNIINHISSKGNELYVSTNNGVFIWNLNTEEYQNLNTNDGIPHNRISQVFIDSEGDAWIASRTNSMYSLTSDKRYKIDGSVELEFVSITEGPGGDLWAVTNGDGVFRFSEDSLIWINTDQGLKSAYGYTITADSEGYIWVGHRLALSRIDPETNMAIGFDREAGISGDCNTNSFVKDDKDRLIFGTTSGLVRYHPTEGSGKQNPPRISITRLYINDEPVDVTQNLVLPYGKYKVRIEFIGINFRDPESVYYQYKMEGYDVDTSWSEPTSESNALYGRLPDGNFTFKVRACNGEGYCSELPANITIKVKPPFWKTWWFITLAIILLIASVYIIIKVRERKQIKFQEYLQKKLDERTKEVVEQKEEIELKNRDITDSINYAQRIQASILPSVQKLQDNFSGSFVFYAPRDIVSGDFYWFDRIDDSKFVIVCADSTGHGVPGAFMSMIGTTLIKDISTRSESDRSPNSILKKLDYEIQNTLNQNVDAEKSNDGMDIFVVEIDVNTYMMRYASAMRPMIIYKDNEEIYIRGSRSTIGGHFSQQEKEFDEESIQLSKGDSVYMFSDGYPDQFGGPMGKKFKMVRLKNMLREIHQQPMDQQYEQVKNQFNQWKSGHEQVDDVLFMGLKL